jgi:cytochrome c-type biogenesis protein
MTSRVRPRSIGDLAAETVAKVEHRGLSVAVALIVVAIVVAAAVLADPEGQLAIGVLTFSAGWGGRLQDLGALVPAAFAFVSGMAAAVNPCGFAMLPGYLALYLHGDQPGRGRPLARALGIGLSVTAAFVLLFGVIGLVLSVAGSLIVGVLPWASVGVGVALVLLGARILGGTPVYVGIAERSGARTGELAQRRNVVGYFAYGLGFGLTSLACTVPLFLAVVGSALAVGGAAAAFIQFILYALGMGLVLTTLALLAAMFSTPLMRARTIGRFLEPAGAILLLVSGAYVIYYWLTIGGLLG